MLHYLLYIRNCAVMRILVPCTKIMVRLALEKLVRVEDTHLSPTREYKMTVNHEE